MRVTQKIQGMESFFTIFREAVRHHAVSLTDDIDLNGMIRFKRGSYECCPLTLVEWALCDYENRPFNLLNMGEAARNIGLSSLERELVFQAADNMSDAAIRARWDRLPLSKECDIARDVFQRLVKETRARLVFALPGEPWGGQNVA